MNYFDSNTCLTQVILPYVVIKRINGTIKNLKDIKVTSCVCKIWNEWVYDATYGPFCSLRNKINPNFIPEHQGRLDTWNILMKISNPWFVFVDECMKLSEDFLGDIKLEEAFKQKVSSQWSHINPNIRNAYGDVPLRKAIFGTLKNKKLLALVEILIRYGANPNISFYYQNKKNILLWYLLTLNYDEIQASEIINFLIKKGGADINLTYGKEKNNFLLYLAKESTLRLIPKTITFFKELGGNLDQEDINGHTIFKLILKKRDKFVLKNCYKLIELGARLGNNNGDSYLHVAARYLDEKHNDSLFQLLLEKSPEKVNVVGTDGFTPLYWAFKTKKISFIDCLLPYFNEKIDPCESLLFSNLLNFFKAHMVKRLIFYHKGSHDDTAYYKNKKRNFKYIYLPLLIRIKAFLSRNDQNENELVLKERDSVGNTFMHQLAQKAPYILTELIHRQLLPSHFLEIKNKQNVTVQMVKDSAQDSLNLIKACCSLDEQKVKHLLAKKIDINFQVDKGYSLLHLTLRGTETEASIKSCLEIIKCLLEAGINPNQADDKGNTPLHKALRTQVVWQIEVLELLCERGANPLQKNSNNESPLDLVSDTWPLAKKLLVKTAKNRAKLP